MERVRITLSPLVVLAAGLIAGLAVALWVRVGGAVDNPPAAVAAGGMVASVAATLTATGQRLIQRALHREAARAHHDARHDALTGLFNRAELFRQLEESLEQGVKDDTVVGVLFLDLDGFKAINDTLGHEAGDELLRVVANRLRATIRSTDVVARLGGDEFVVVCRGLLSTDSVISVARQVMRRLGDPVMLDGSVRQVGTSIGVATARPLEERVAEDLVRDADSAMYRAKRDRRGYVVFDDGHRQEQMDREVTERQLARAVNDSQFTVFYQPIVDVAGARLHGFEALVRWQHPERGLIAPGDFLSEAESSRLLPKIGEVVLREACAQAALWAHDAPRARSLPIAVNMAAQQIVDPYLVSLVADALEWSGLDPGQLVLEVPDGLLTSHIDSLDNLRQLAALGVGITIDSFGTGYNAFKDVDRFDIVSAVKIDRSFVADLDRHPQSVATVQAMVGLAGALGMDVVAEGVEDASQVTRLGELGVSLMQGFLFHAPVYADLVDPESWFGAGIADEAPDLGYRPVVADTA